MMENRYQDSVWANATKYFTHKVTRIATTVHYHRISDDVQDEKASNRGECHGKLAIKSYCRSSSKSIICKHMQL
jgi:hypothetical protein